MMAFIYEMLVYIRWRCYRGGRKIIYHRHSYEASRDESFLILFPNFYVSYLIDGLQ